MFRRSRSSRRGANPRPQRRVLLSCEPLEDRTMLDAGLAAGPMPPNLLQNLAQFPARAGVQFGNFVQQEQQLLSNFVQQVTQALTTTPQPGTTLVTELLSIETQTLMAQQTLLGNFITALENDLFANNPGGLPSPPGIPLPLPTPTSGQALIDLHLEPINLQLLGLDVQTNQIEIAISDQPGNGELLGNLLSIVGNLVNLQGVNTALNTVLNAVITLVNSSTLTVNGVDTSGPLGTAPSAATTPVLDLFVSPVHLDLLGALVDTSPIHLTLTAQSGQGLILGNVITDLANLFNPPLPQTLNIDDLNNRLENLINELNAQAPNIPSAPTSPVTFGPGQILSLTVPSIDVNLLGLVLFTEPIQVNATAQTGNGDLLGNLLQVLLNTTGATPDNLSTLNNNLNTLLAKVVGILNASSLTLPPGALDSLTPVLQSLALPNLFTASGTNTQPILNLDIMGSSSSSPPVLVNLLGLQVTTSNIQAQLLAQTGDGEVLGNLLFNVANLLNPGGSLNVLTLLSELGL